MKSQQAGDLELAIGLKLNGDEGPFLAGPLGISLIAETFQTKWHSGVMVFQPRLSRVFITYVLTHSLSH